MNLTAGVPQRLFGVDLGESIYTHKAMQRQTSMSQRMTPRPRHRHGTRQLDTSVVVGNLTSRLHDPWIWSTLFNHGQQRLAICAQKFYLGTHFFTDELRCLNGCRLKILSCDHSGAAT
jgi:hypothetical protein